MRIASWLRKSVHIHRTDHKMSSALIPRVFRNEITKLKRKEIKRNINLRVQYCTCKADDCILQRTTFSFFKASNSMRIALDLKVIQGKALSIATRYAHKCMQSNSVSPSGSSPYLHLPSTKYPSIPSSSGSWRKIPRNRKERESIFLSYL